MARKVLLNRVYRDLESISIRLEKLGFYAESKVAGLLIKDIETSAFTKENPDKEKVDETIKEVSQASKDENEQ